MFPDPSRGRYGGPITSWEIASIIFSISILVLVVLF